MLHFWYGGRYPKAGDIYHNGGNQPATHGYWNYVNAFSSPYPPQQSYIGERDVFARTAQKEPDQSQDYIPEIKQLIQTAQEEKRVEFNREILAQVASRVPTSVIFKAAQEIDAYFKILDSLLTFMYNDLMRDSGHPLCKQLVGLKGNDENYIKDGTALIRYLQNYSAKHNPEHNQGNYLPFYLRTSTEKITRVLNEITSSECKPQFNSVMRVVDLSMPLLIIIACEQSDHELLDSKQIRKPFY